MKKLLGVVLLVILAGMAGWYGAGLRQHDSATTETALERVTRTKTLRCAYAMWPPAVLDKNPNTGVLSGMAVEIAETAAAKLGWIVEWTEEAGWSSYIEGLHAGRYDMFCAMPWQRSMHAKEVAASVPIMYSALHLFARADDHRFDGDIAFLNDPQYKVSVMDGEFSQIYPAKYFPKATQVAITELGDVSHIFLNVATGKADVVFNEVSLARGYAEKNPGTVRQVSKKPLAVHPNVYTTLRSNKPLMDVWNVALTEMHNFGEMDAIIEKYEPDRSIFMPVSPDYKYVDPAPLP